MGTIVIWTCHFENGGSLEILSTLHKSILPYVIFSLTYRNNLFKEELKKSLL